MNPVLSFVGAVAVVYALRLLRVFQAERWYRLTDADRAKLSLYGAIGVGVVVHTADHGSQSLWSVLHLPADVVLQLAIQQVLHDVTHFRHTRGPLR